MFGWNRIEHDRRYEMAAEFLDAVQQLWAQPDNFSYTPELSSWRLGGAFVTPKPRYGRPLLINATGPMRVSISPHATRTSCSSRPRPARMPSTRSLRCPRIPHG